MANRKRQRVTKGALGENVQGVSPSTSMAPLGWVTLLIASLRSIRDLCRTRFPLENLGVRNKTPAMARKRVATIRSCNAAAATAAITGNAKARRLARALAENRFRRIGSPRAIQSFIPPTSGKAFKQPADRNMPVARLAWRWPPSEMMQMICLVGRNFR